MEERPPLDSPIQAFLDTALIDFPLIYIDIWSFVHLASGVLLGAMFARWTRPLHALAWAVGLILAYEVFELALVDVLFVPEAPVDTIWDAIIGFTGAFIALRITLVRQRRKAERAESMYL